MAYRIFMGQPGTDWERATRARHERKLQSLNRYRDPVKDAKPCSEGNRKL